MQNKSKKLKIFLAVFAVIFAFSLALFLSDRSERFEMTEKNIIAMDTVVTEKIYAKKDSATYIKSVSDIITGLEDKISRFDSSSAVYALNSDGTVTDNSVSTVVTMLTEISDATDGAFDITVGELSDLWGIGSDEEKIPDKEEIEKVLSQVGYNALKVDGTTVTLESKASVDLGAVGKGFACDLIKTYLEATEAEGAIVSVGGSILAYGDYNKKGDKWSIAIRHPRNESEFLGVISLDEGFVSTSGDYERYFEKDGKRYHHIFDATTGYPASSGLISVTVVSDSGILSDALSTACFISGAEKGRELVEKYNSSAIFVDEDLNIITVGDIDFEKQ